MKKRALAGVAAALVALALALATSGGGGGEVAAPDPNIWMI